MEQASTVIKRANLFAFHCSLTIHIFVRATRFATDKVSVSTIAAEIETSGKGLYYTVAGRAEIIAGGREMRFIRSMLKNYISFGWRAKVVNSLTLRKSYLLSRQYITASTSLLCLLASQRNAPILNDKFGSGGLLAFGDDR